MITDFPHNSFSKLRQPTGQRLSNIRTQQTKISIGPILFLYYEESLVSSNSNSKQLRFHGAHQKIYKETKHEKRKYYVIYVQIVIPK